MTAVEITGPGVYALTDEEYFGAALATTTLSSTGAKELLKPGGPARYRHQRDNGTTVIKREFDLGHAVHTLVLGSGPEPVRVSAEKWLSNAVKEQVTILRAEGKVPLRPSDFEAAVAMAVEVRKHPIAAKLFTRGLPEQAIIWRDDATGVMCRLKADWLRPDGIVDLKTAESASADALSKAVHNYGYFIQDAFYRRGFRAQHPGVEPFFAFVVVEKTAPYLVHVVQLMEHATAYGDRRVSEALEIYRDCTTSGEWHGYPTDKITDIDLPAWVHTEEWR